MYKFPDYDNLEKDPTDDELRSGIKHILDKKESYYNDSSEEIFAQNGENRMLTYYNTGFSQLAAKKLTRLDFGGSRGMSNNELLQIAFPRWFARQEAYHIQQEGTRDLDKEKTINVDGIDYTVNCWKRSNPFWTWRYWKKGDIIYDLIRSWADPILDGLEATGVSDISLAKTVLIIYKSAISKAHMGFSNFNTTPFALEV